MRVLIGCEESGTVRRAFRERGHDAWSCDLLPARDKDAHHFDGDILYHLGATAFWDLIILHPDCTKVAVCGNKTWAGTDARYAQVEWILRLWALAKNRSPRVALENPASVIWPPLRRAGATVQFIHPWQHGHPEQKKTGLALHGLPPLVESNNVHAKMMGLTPQERERVFRMAPGADRKRDRSKTYEGIADAMADQWGNLELSRTQAA